MNEDDLSPCWIMRGIAYQEMAFKYIFEAIESEQLRRQRMSEQYYRRVKCPDCYWWKFKGGEPAGMIPCSRCGSMGYIYELCQPDESPTFNNALDWDTRNIPEPKPDPNCPKCKGNGEYYIRLPDDFGSPNLVKCDCHVKPMTDFFAEHHCEFDAIMMDVLSRIASIMDAECQAKVDKILNLFARSKELDGSKWWRVMPEKDFCKLLRKE